LTCRHAGAGRPTTGSQLAVPGLLAGHRRTMRRPWRRGQRALSAGFTIATCGTLRGGRCVIFHDLQRRPGPGRSAARRLGPAGGRERVARGGGWGGERCWRCAGRLIKRLHVNVSGLSRDRPLAPALVEPARSLSPPLFRDRLRDLPLDLISGRRRPPIRSGVRRLPSLGVAGGTADGTTGAESPLDARVILCDSGSAFRSVPTVFWPG
jgi:hypothetical protein